MDINSQEHINTIAPVVAQAYKLGKEQKYAEAYEILVPHFEAKEIPSFFEEPCGWAIYRYLKNYEKKLSTLEIRKALAFYLSFASCKSSALHSCIMMQAVNLEKKHENDFRFIEFCLMWKLENLRDEDYKEYKGTLDNGKNIEIQSLAENVATRLYKEMKSRHTEEFVDKLLPFFNIVGNRCPKNKFIRMYIAQMYYWKGEPETAINEYRDILRTNPEWYIWKHLGDILEDKDLRVSMYCKAMTIMGKDDYIVNLRLGLAGLLMGKDDGQAAYEIAQYMETYKKNGWTKIPGDAYILQNKLKDVSPSNHSKQFYAENVSNAEEFAYSDIPVIELTFTGIRKNHAGKDRAHLQDKRKNISLQVPCTPSLKEASIGDVFNVRLQQNEIQTKALTIHPSGKRVKVQRPQSVLTATDTGKSKTICGTISIPPKGDYCFINHEYYVPERIRKEFNLQAQQVVNAKVKQMPDGRWKVITIIKDK